MDLTRDRALELLNEIAAEKPDNYTYTSDPKTADKRLATPGNAKCFYEHADKTPGCIIGHLIHRLNPEFDLSEVEKMGADKAAYAAGIYVDRSVAGFLCAVQSRQDNGHTWKASVERTIADGY